MCGRYFIDSDEPTMGAMLSALSPETPIHGSGKAHVPRPDAIRPLPDPCQLVL